MLARCTGQHCCSFMVLAPLRRAGAEPEVLNTPSCLPLDYGSSALRCCCQHQCWAPYVPAQTALAPLVLPLCCPCPMDLGPDPRLVLRQGDTIHVTSPMSCTFLSIHLPYVLYSSPHISPMSFIFFLMSPLFSSSFSPSGPLLEPWAWCCPSRWYHRGSCPGYIPRGCSCTWDSPAGARAVCPPECTTPCRAVPCCAVPCFVCLDMPCHAASSLGQPHAWIPAPVQTTHSHTRQHLQAMFIHIPSSSHHPWCWCSTSISS